MRRVLTYLSVCVPEVSVIASALHMVRGLGFIRDQTEKTAGHKEDILLCHSTCKLLIKYINDKAAI